MLIHISKGGAIMRGQNNGGYLMRGDSPYDSYGEAEERLRRIRRDNPEMRPDYSMVSKNNIWYYEIVPYGNGYAVLSSYTKC